MQNVLRDEDVDALREENSTTVQPMIGGEVGLEMAECERRHPLNGQWCKRTSERHRRPLACYC